MIKQFYILSCVLFFNTLPLFAQNIAQDKTDGEAVSSPLMMMPWGRWRGAEGADQNNHGEEQGRLLDQDGRNRDADQENQIGAVELTERAPALGAQQEDEEGLQLNAQDRQLIDALKQDRAIRTMAALKAIDVASSTDLSSSLWALVTGRMTATQAYGSVLILNNTTTPFYLRIPASGTQARFSTLAAMIIPVGFQTYLEDGREGSVVPRRVPTAQENQQIRRLIKDTLDIYYGCNVPERMAQLDPTLRSFYESLESPENRDRALTVGELQFLLPSDEGESLRNIATRHPEIDLPPNLPFTSEPVRILAESISNHPNVDRLIDFSQTNLMDEQFIRNREQAFDEINRRLSSPWQSLGKACWKSAEGIANQCRLVFLQNILALPNLLVTTVVVPSIVWGFWRGLIYITPPYVYVTGRSYQSQEPCIKGNLLLNRTIDIRDHLVALDMFKDYVDLRYHSVDQIFNKSDLSVKEFMSSNWPPSSKWLIPSATQGTPYEKGLIQEFGFSRNEYTYRAMRFFSPRALPFLFTVTGPLLREPLDWVYANFAGIGYDWPKQEHGEYVYPPIMKKIHAYEWNRYIKYLPKWNKLYIEGLNSGYDRDQLADKDRSLLQPYSLRDDYYFDSRLHEPVLRAKRDELKRKMKPVMKQYIGLDIGKCSQMIEEKYKKAKAEQEKKREKAHAGWNRAAFVVGFGGPFSMFTCLLYSELVNSARHDNDPLIRQSDRAFYEAAQASQEVGQYLGLGMGIHQSVSNSLEQAQQYDRELYDIIRSIFPNAEQHQEAAENGQGAGSSILRVIAARIAHRSEIIRELERRIGNRGRLLSFTR